MTTTDEPLRDRRDYASRPIVFDAALAHRHEWIVYDDDCLVTCRHPALAGDAMRIPTSRQFPCVRSTFDDLNKSLSRLSNSPKSGDKTLRQRYDEEVLLYDAMVSAALAEGRVEPSYGTYVLDRCRGDLYHIAPAEWHRLALVTSNSMILTDPEASLSWQQVRAKLEGAVVGFAGLSVGGNCLEGWLREARPAQVKIADPDWVELTNGNRCERMSLRHMVQPRASRFDAKNPYENPRVPKAHYVAYEQSLVDPYATFWVYDDGVTRSNMDRFLCGDGGSEPAIDVLVEETDDIQLKLLLREACRARGIDVLMLSDYGHGVHAMWNSFRLRPGAPLGHAGDDERLRASLSAAKAGDRAQVFAFIDALCGAGWSDDRCDAWMAGRGEQPTSSLPQSGATSLCAGGIAGKELALHVLGHGNSLRGRVIYDLARRRVRD